MKELLCPHWIGGTLLAIAGAITYRFGHALGDLRLPVQIVGLLLVPVGLFWIARGVSVAAAKRDPDSEP